MPAHLLFLLLIIIVCNFHIISGGKFVSCHQSSNESLLGSCRLLAWDWRKTWKMKANSYSDHQMTASRFTLLVTHMSHWQCRVPVKDCRTRNTIKARFTELCPSWKLHRQLINLNRKMISPGGTGSSSKLTSFPNLWARMALWYCCRRREIEYSNTAAQMLLLWSKRRTDLLQEIVFLVIVLVIFIRIYILKI